MVEQRYNWTHFELSAALAAAGRFHFDHMQCNQAKKISVKCISQSENNVAVVRFKLATNVSVNGTLIHVEEAHSLLDLLQIFQNFAHLLEMLSCILRFF